MPLTLKSFLQRWAIITLGVLVASNIVSGIDYDNWEDLLVASLILGILNAFVRPIMMLLSLPLVVFTFGLFIWIINALLLYSVGLMMEDFKVAGFGTALIGALIISFISLLANSLTGAGNTRVHVRTRTRSKPGGKNRDDDDDSGGPVIDV
jgi:putative membrane protein